MQGAVAEEVKRDSNLTLVDTRHPSMFWIEFTEQWIPSRYGMTNACAWRSTMP